MEINSRVIALAMARNQITQAELAQRSGISRPSVSTILTRGSCSIVNAGKLAKALNLDVSEIVKEV